MPRAILIFLFLCSSFGIGQQSPWSGILDPSRAIDWSTAGIPGGVPNITIQCGNTLQPSGGNDTAAIQAAVNGCSATTTSFVQLAAGTFHTTGQWTIPTHVVLRGMGADQTIIQVNGTSATYSATAISLGGSLSATPNEPMFSRVMQITSNNSKGDTTVTVASIGQATISQLAVGDMVWIAPLNDWIPACAGYPSTPPPLSTSHCMNMGTDIELGSIGGGSGWNMDGAYGANSYNQRGSGQMDLITNIDTVNGILTLEDPLVDSFRRPLQDWRANSPANVLTGFNKGMAIFPSGQTATPPHVFIEAANTGSIGYCLTGPTAPLWTSTGGTGNTVMVTETVPGIASPNVACQWLDSGPGTDSSPRLMYWVPNVNVALENLQIVGMNNILAGPFQTLVTMNNCLHCWTKGIEINRPVGFITATFYSYHGQIEQNFYTTSWYHGSGTDSVIDVDSGTSGFLIQNNIFERTPEAVFTDNGGSGNVIAYNYSLGNWGANGINNGTNTLLSHDAFPWFNLQEGNIVTQAAQDGIHGGNALSTNFRNWFKGTTKICQPISATGLTGGVPTRPPVPSVTTNAVGGTTTYSYAVEVVVGGAPSAPSVNATINNGPATLSATTYNTIIAPNIPNLYTLWNNGTFTSTTPPPDVAPDMCLIYRTAGGPAAQISPVGVGVPCDGVTPVQDTGQASTGAGINGTGVGQLIIPGTIAKCTPLSKDFTTAGTNAWLAYQGVWAQNYNQFSSNHNDVGNVTGSQDVMTVSSYFGYPERRKSCQICSSHCQNNGVTCGGGGTTCAVVACGVATNFSGIYDEILGMGSGVGNLGAWDTTLAQDTAFHCQNYYHSLQAVEAGDCASNTVLPPSFYLTAKPAWWGAAPWPPIGPDVTGGLAQSFGYAYNNPAKNCYENVMGGTDSTGAPFLHFNAAACYSLQTAPATPWAGIIPNARAIDWSHAGVMIRSSTQVGCQWVGQYPDCVSGLPSNRPPCTLTGSYAVNNVVQPSGLQDYTDAYNINDALQKCGAVATQASPLMVQLAAGNFYIVGGVTFGGPANPFIAKTNVNNVTLRGAGPDKTFFRVTSPGFQDCGSANAICIAGSNEAPSSQYYPYKGACQWTAGYAKDSTTLTFANCVGGLMPQQGYHIILDQRNDDIGLTQCTSSGSVATCTVSLPQLPSTFVVGACVGLGAINNNAGMSTASTPGYNVQPLSPVATPNAGGCNHITAVTTNTFSYNLPYGSNLPQIGPCYTPTSSPTPGPYTANAQAYVGGYQVTSCGWATVDTGSLYVTGVPCVTMAGQCGWNQLSGGITIGRFCPDISNYSGSIPTGSPDLSRNISCAPGELSVRSQTQVVTVTAVNGNQVTIDTPIYATNWRPEQSPGVFWYTQTATCCVQHDDGIENLTFDSRKDGGGSSSTIISMSKCYNCWVRNVRSISGNRNHVWFQNGAAHCTVRDSYFYGTKAGATSSYGIETYNASGDLLLENNIFNNIPSGLMNGGTWGSVESYNYGTDDGNPNPNWLYGTISMNHDINGDILFEGNDSNGAGTDDIHGTISGVITEFRSRERGQQNQPYKNNSLSAMILASHNRGMNFIGGVYGVNGAHTTYQKASTATTPGPGNNNYNRILFAIGSTSQGGSTMIDDMLVLPSLMKWGNYNVLTPGGPAGVLWCGFGTETNCNNVSEMAQNLSPFLPATPVPASHTLPASFYRAAKPAWFVTPWGTPPWPPIGPDISGGTAPDTEPCPNRPNNGYQPGSIQCTAGYSYSIPAQLAFDNMVLDTSFQVPQTVTGATYNAGVVTLTGTFNIPVYGTFQLSGMTPAVYDGIYQVYATNGSTQDVVAGSTNSVSFATCPTGYTCSSPGTGLSFPAGPASPGGQGPSIYVTTTRVNSGTGWETTHTSILKQSIAATCQNTPPTGSCAVQIGQPCFNAVSSGVPSGCTNGGYGVGGANASDSYNVYMGYSFVLNAAGTAWVPNSILCKQNATPIPFKSPPPTGWNTSDSWGNAYIQRDPLITPASGNCIQPPIQSTATASQIQYLLLGRDGSTLPDPGAPGTGGTVVWPIIKQFNADAFYGIGTLPPSTSPAGINGHGKITGQGKIN